MCVYKGEGHDGCFCNDTCVPTEVKVVKQMPIQTSGSRPTVAIITSKYYEKLAVDAMMTEKTTFVKYKTEGETGLLSCNKVSVSSKMRNNYLF